MISLMMLQNRHSTLSTASLTLSVLEATEKSFGFRGAGCINLFHRFWPVE